MLPYYKYNTLEAGLDEAGRGSLMGDVYAAAVILPMEMEFEINDSKKLSKRKRLIFKDYIEEEAIDYAVAYVEPEIIDKINILNASLKAMHKSLKGLNVDPEYLIIDGDRFKTYYDSKGSFVPYKCIVNGDTTYSSIAAASILAKVYHDAHINKLCDEYPQLDEYYGLRSNMGYGTKKHLEGIEKYGITKFHRKSYKTSFNKDIIDI